MRKVSLLAGVLCAVVLVGCASSPQPSAEMQQRLLAAYQQRLQQTNNKLSNPTLLKNNVNPIVTKQTSNIHKQQQRQNISEAELAKEINSIPPMPASTTIQFYHDGFTINGSHYIDPEGEIKWYSLDRKTGNMVYSIKSDSRDYNTSQNGEVYAIKFTRVGGRAPAILIATAIHVHGGYSAITSEKWKIETVSGKKVSGKTLSLVPKGFLLERGNQDAAFLYTIGSDIITISPPHGYYIPSIKEHFFNIKHLSTNYILLKKHKAVQNEDLFYAIKGISRVVQDFPGEYDYALYNFHTGHLIKLEMSADDGKARVKWVKLHSGVYAIYITHVLTDVYAVDLVTGFRKRLFHRSGLGWVTGFYTQIESDGKLNVGVGGGVLGHDEKIDDLEAFMSAPKEKESALIHTVE